MKPLQHAASLCNTGDNFWVLGQCQTLQCVKLNLLLAISIASSLRHIEWKKGIQKAKQLLTLFGPRISLHTNALQCLEKAGKKKGPSTALHTDV